MVTVARPASAQTFPTDDPVIRRIWQLGMQESHAYRLAQELMDSIGPRLTGSPQIKAGNDWAVKTYTSWGIPARNEQYGTWLGWNRGPTEIVLLAPRVRSLEGTMLAWSAGTNGRPVEGPFVALPDFSSRAEFEGWLPQASGKFVGLDLAQPTCRPDRQWEEFALPATFARMRAERDTARRQWTAWRGTGQSGISANQIRKWLEDAGALGVVHSSWSNDYGVNKIFGTSLRRIPTLDLSCEDYGLIFRMSRNNQNPRLRVTAQSEYLGEIPVFNTIAEMKGTQPNEYVMLSAHFDSWDSSSGSTDNGTGTIVMMEAMRILKLAYPNPKRTILVGHWSGEEQGLNGSRAFARDHPEIVTGLQSLFNQDNGTGRVLNIGMAGLAGAGPLFQNWVAKIPTEISSQINLGIPGSPSGGGSDNASFICAGAPAFGLGALNWGYGTYTWHTNRDTFDKVVFDDLKNNATLTAMLVYLASEEPQRMPRDRAALPAGRGGQPQQWPECRDGARTSTEYFSR
jgi:hypothetical protein